MENITSGNLSTPRISPITAEPLAQDFIDDAKQPG